MREKILKLFEVNHAMENYTHYIDMWTNSIMSNLDDASIATKAMNCIKSVFSEEMPAMTEKFIKLYADNYTEDEIDAMIAWHTSPTGKKMESLSKHMATEGFRIGNSIEPKIMAAFQKLAEKENINLNG